MNEIARVCEKFDADVDKVRLGIGTDSRIGKRFIFPGIGYGGSCFPKDVQALVRSSDQVDYDFKILKAVEEVNQDQKTILMPKIKNFFGNMNGKKIAIWGLAFKPNTDDIREAPARYMIRALLDEGATISAYDPEAMDNIRDVIGDKIHYAKDMYAALQNADALLIVTEWAAFRNPNFDKMVEAMNQRVIFDGRNVFDLDQMDKLGFYYASIGRTTII